MSTRAETVLEQFKALSRTEQWAVYEAIARAIAPEEYKPLTDEELTAIADQTFVLLDKEEADAQPR